MLCYARAATLARMGRSAESAAAYGEAALADPEYVFPGRLEEMQVLEDAIRCNPGDARAPYYLGNLLYDRRRYHEAIEMWERAVELDPQFPTAWRNLGFACFNVLRDPPLALDAFAHARTRSPNDARILFEYDQLKKRTGESPQARLAELEANRELVDRRDDLSVELATLYNNVGMPEAALTVLTARKLQPW